MSLLLAKSSWRYFLQHPWLFGLSILGVALGVAMVIAIDLANTSAQTAFELSADRVTGKATHQVVGTTGPLNDAVYRQLRVDQGIRPSAPIVEGYATLPASNRSLQLLGIDPLADSPFRPYVGEDSALDLSAFMAHLNTGLLSVPTARALNLSVGDSLALNVQGIPHKVRIIGLIKPQDAHSRQALENLLLVDIATAQKLLGMRGQLSHIDLILPQGPAGEDLQQALVQALPPTAQLVRSSSRTETVKQMTKAFELNLSALSLLALVVGMFLIYNTMTFSVVQRRNLIGRLRALGVTRKEMFTNILGEALLIGVLGTAAGLGLGYGLASLLVELVTQTINDLYYVVTVRELTLSTGTFLKGIGLGLGATLASAVPPAYEATTASVNRVIQRSQQESSLRSALQRLSIGGALVGLVAAGLLFLPSQSITLSYIALFLVLAAFALLTPAAVVLLARIFRPLMDRLFGVLGRMAARGIITTLSRTAVAIAALSIAVASTVGVGVMVNSFRTTVTVWLDYALQADIYVQPPTMVFRQNEGTLDPALVRQLANTPGVANAYTIRSVQVASEHGPTNLVAVEHSPHVRQTIRFKKQTSTNTWQVLDQQQAVIVSEPYSYRHQVQPGDSVRLQTDQGRQAFAVKGIFYDYGSEFGAVMISRSLYDKYYNDKGSSGLALYTAPGQPTEQVIQRLRQQTTPQQPVVIRSNKALREASMRIFDRTFTVTTVLRLLALVVAFVGVLSALMALQLERTRELGVLRATGMTPGQLGGYISLQTGLMGLISGLMALPLGLLLAALLIYVINKRSFGWTLQLALSSELLIQAVLLAFIAAVLAGLYPAWKMVRTSPSEALRAEG